MFHLILLWKIIIFILFIPLIIRQYKLRRSAEFLIYFIGFIAYSIEAFGILFFPIIWSIPVTTHGPMINTIPFHTISEMLSTQKLSVSVKQIVGNVAIFVPLGGLAPMLFKKMNNLLRILMLGIAVSGTVEVVQFVIDAVTRYPNRAADIDDVLLNIVGVLIGFIIQKNWKKISRKFLYTEDVKDGGA